MGRKLFVGNLSFNTDERRLEEPDHGGQDLLAGQAGAFQVVVKVGAQLGEGLAEGRQAVILGGVAYGTPARMVAVLLAAPSVASRRLEVSIGPRTDPHVSPGRWNDESLDAA